MLVEILGVAQDGGVPHLGCDCERCTRARADPTAVRYPASLLLRGESRDATGTSDADGTPPRFLVDAPPELRLTLPTLPDGILLTHAHLGHLPGLLALGPEAGDASDLPVYCTPSLARLVRENDPFAVLVEGDHIDLRPVEPGGSVTLADATVEFHPVPHRSETGTDTVALLVAGPARSLCYLPDIDRWTDDAVALVERADLAFVDGTFYEPGEIDHQEDVPHPAVVETMGRFADCDTAVRFTHLNHTNPLLDDDSAAREAVAERGFGVLERGETVGI